MTLKISLNNVRTVNDSHRSELIQGGRVVNEFLFVDYAVFTALNQKYRVQPKPTQLPSVATQAKNLMGATGKALLNPKPVSAEERDRRLAICHACEFLVDGKRCQKCGCHVNWKSRLEAWHCPIEKW